MKMTSYDRLFLLFTGLLAAYQIAVGIDGLSTLPTLAYTIAFGALLIAALLLLILGFEVLDSPVVVIVSTIIPLTLSLGLVAQYLPGWQTAYLVFAVTGFLAVVVTRLLPVSKELQTFVLAIVHGVAGMTIFLLPVVLTVEGSMDPAFILVSVGGALIGAGGLLPSFLKMGKPLLPRETILKILPALLLVVTFCFVAGFKLG